MFQKSTDRPKPAIPKVEDKYIEFSIADLNDAEIWEEFRRGNEGAFNHIYKTFFQDLYKYGQQFTSDLDLIRDIIQDLFIYIRKNRTNLGKAPSIKFYLLKAFRRDILRFFKRNKLVYTGRIESFCTFRIEASHEIRLLQSQLNDEKKLALEAAFCKLSKRQKEAIYYYYYQSMSYKEVALIMDLRNIKSARNLIYKSIEAMKTQIDPIKRKLFY